MIFLVLVWVNLLVFKHWFLNSTDGDEIDIKGNIEQFIELLLGLILQIELPFIILLRMRRVFVLVPCVPLKSIKQIIVCGHKVVVVKELVVV
jgi:hypothetical protein